MNIDDIVLQDLQECFHLAKPATFLLEEKANKFIDSKELKSEVKGGFMFHIREAIILFCFKSNVLFKKHNLWIILTL